MCRTAMVAATESEVVVVDLSLSLRRRKQQSNWQLWQKQASHCGQNFKMSKNHFEHFSSKRLAIQTYFTDLEGKKDLYFLDEIIHNRPLCLWREAQSSAAAEEMKTTEASLHSKAACSASLCARVAAVVAVAVADAAPLGARKGKAIYCCPPLK